MIIQQCFTSIQQQKQLATGFSREGSDLGGSSCMVKITPNAPNLNHAKK